MWKTTEFKILARDIEFYLGMEHPTMVWSSARENPAPTLLKGHIRREPF
jgi:hypothetical protein